MSRAPTCLAGLTAVVIAALTTAPAPAGSLTPEERLVEQFTMDANLALEFEPLSLDAVEAALVLMEVATELRPDDLAAWEQLLDLTVLAERHDLRHAALKRIVRLDPANEMARLQLIGLDIDRLQTADERIERYKELLTPKRRQQIGDEVASRLALDLALLYQRRGDEASFATWLAESVALDAGHRVAAALSAGYFRSRVGDVYKEAELLVNLMLADPAGAGTQIELGQLLLGEGAYTGAARLLAIALRREPGTEDKHDLDLQSDLALAQWGAGDIESALITLDRQHRARSERFRAVRRAEDSMLTPLELARLSAPIEPTAAAMRAAIFDRTDDSDTGIALDRAMRAFDDAIAELQNHRPDATDELARLHLDKAGIVLWLGRDGETARSLISTAETFRPLTDGERRNLDGWLSFADGNVDEAIRQLQPLADTDPTARLGLALAELERHGDAALRTAARHLLSVARERPDSVLGVWAADYLFELIGKRAAIGDSARRLDELIASIPTVFDRYPKDVSLAVGVRLRPTKTEFAPYEPIIVNLEITNNALYPLAIHPDGPITPQVLMFIDLRLSQVLHVRNVPPIVVDIDQRVTLQPREKIVVPVDLRRYRLGQRLNQAPLPGALISLRAITNFVAGNVYSHKPGPLGVKVEAQPFRVNGVRINRPWIENAMAEVVHLEHPRDIEVIANLSHIAGAGLAASLPAPAQRLLADCVSALREVYPRLDPVAQAWLLTVMRKGPTVDPIVNIARQSDHPLVQMAILIYYVRDLDDPMLRIAQNSDNERLQRLANASIALMKQRLDPFELDRLPGEMQMADSPLEP